MSGSRERGTVGRRGPGVFAYAVDDERDKLSRKSTSSLRGLGEGNYGLMYEKRTQVINAGLIGHFRQKIWK